MKFALSATMMLVLTLAVPSVMAEEVVTIERVLSVDADNSITWDKTYNLANATPTAKDSWPSNLTNGSWVGSGLPESLWNSNEMGSVTTSTTVEFEASEVMSGASSGWVRSPLPSDGTDDISMDIYACDNPKQAELYLGEAEADAFGSRVITTTAQFNGTTWVATSDSGTGEFYDLCDFKNYLVGSSQPDIISRSIDGVTWEDYPVDADLGHGYTCVVFDGYLYVGGDDDGHVYRSNDWATWQEVLEQLTDEIGASIEFMDQVYFVTNDQEIYRSSTGNPGTFSDIWDVATDAEELEEFDGYLYVGDENGDIYRSPTGDSGSWVLVHNSAATGIYSMNATASHLYVGGAAKSQLMRTSDGTTWEDIWDSGKTGIYEVTNVADRIWVNAYSGTSSYVYLSQEDDGVRFSLDETFTGNNLYDGYGWKEQYWATQAAYLLGGELQGPFVWTASSETGINSGQFETRDINTNYIGNFSAGNGEIGLAQTEGVYRDFDAGNPVGLWHFGDDTNDDFKDDSFYNLDATGYNSPTYGEGVVGKCIDLNGNNERGEIAHDPVHLFEYMTISYWAKSDKTDYTSNGIILTKAVDGGGTLLSSYVRYSTDRMRFLFRGDDDALHYAEASSNIDLNLHFWVGTFDGSDIYLYMDGIEVGHTSFSGTIDQDSPGWEGIGGHPTSHDKYWDGEIDELMLLNYALDPDQVWELYSRHIASGDYLTPAIVAESVWGGFQVIQTTVTYNCSNDTDPDIDEISLYGGTTPLFDNATHIHSWTSGGDYNVVVTGAGLWETLTWPTVTGTFSYFWVGVNLSTTSKNRTVVIGSISLSLQLPLRPYGIVPHPLCHPTLVWSWDYNSTDQLREYDDGRDYLKFQAPIYPNQSYVVLFDRGDAAGPNITSSIWVTPSDIGENNIEESFVTYWTESDGYINLSLPADLGISFLFEEGMGYSIRGLGVNFSETNISWVQQVDSYNITSDNLTIVFPFISDEPLDINITLELIFDNFTGSGVYADIPLSNCVDFYIYSGLPSWDAAASFEFTYIDFNVTCVNGTGNDTRIFLIDNNTDLLGDYRLNRMFTNVSGNDSAWYFRPWCSVSNTENTTWTLIDYAAMYRNATLAAEPELMPVSVSYELCSVDFFSPIWDFVLSISTGGTIDRVTLEKIYEATVDLLTITVVLPGLKLLKDIGNFAYSVGFTVYTIIEWVVTRFQDNLNAILATISFVMFLPLIVVVFKSFNWFYKVGYHSLKGVTTDSKKSIEHWEEVKDLTHLGTKGVKKQ